MRHTGSDPGRRRRTAPTGALRGYGTEFRTTDPTLTCVAPGPLRRGPTTGIGTTAEAGATREA